MKVLVCGGRDFSDVQMLWNRLDHIDIEIGIRCVVTGGQRSDRMDGRTFGADYWGHQWALARNKPTEEYQADWNNFGRAAGPIRNQRMMDESKPDFVVAFPGGRGTEDMVDRARRAGVRVIEPK